MTIPDSSDELLRQAASSIAAADGLLIMAGAGMGVDSGLPDFRGTSGFWKAYPALRGIPFEKMSTPFWFESDPTRAWGFFGHRLRLYRETIPHDGFAHLLRFAASKNENAFVVTSNVDGQFQKAGFTADCLLEVHGTIHHLQCSWHCTSQLFEYTDWLPNIDEQELRCQSELPTCPRCGRVARPNILMFNDSAWVSSRSDQQAQRFDAWLQTNKRSSLVVLEIGAGQAVQTIRHLSRTLGFPVVRINPRDNDPAPGIIPLQLSALDALTQIASLL